MIGWIYLVGATIAFVAATRMTMHRIAANEIHKRENDPFYGSLAEKRGWPVTEGMDVGLAVSIGLGVAAFWPLAVVLGIILLLFRGFTPKIERDYEKQQRDAAELAALRKLAREHNLPMPGAESADGAR
jgi:hypothetical protein